jgi:2-methylisocitrate lyase-like PEP mutase family enzyme
MGVAGIHIEDQGFPKRCGHLDDKELIPLDAYLAKIRAATEARHNPDFIIIARTDSGAVAGFEEAIRRANAALTAGADMAFVEAPLTMEELAAVPKRVNGPCLLNLVRLGKSPDIDLATAREIGYRLAIVPGLLFTCVVGACEAALAELKQTGRHPVPPKDLPLKEVFRRFGADEWDVVRNRYKVLKAGE